LEEDHQKNKKQPTDIEGDIVPITGNYPNVPRASVILKYIPDPDMLEVKHGEEEFTLITNDGTAVTTELCSALISRGHKVTVLTFPKDLIQPGKHKLPKGIKEVKLRDTNDATIGAAISALKGSVSQFVHLHPHLRFPLGKLGLQFEKEKGLIKSVYFLAKHLKEPLTDLAEKHRTAFLVITRMDGAMGMKNPGNISVFGGGLFGLTKCLNLEWNKVFCRGTDIAPQLNAKYTAQKIYAELYDADQCLTDTCYSHKEKRYTLLAKPMTGIKKGQEIKFSITDKSVFLVTGGARGITADCVRQMAVSFKCKFILVGRSELQTKEPEWAIGINEEKDLKRNAMEALKASGEKPLPKIVQGMVGDVMAQREIEANLAFIKEQGGQFEYVAADVTDAKALKAAIKKGSAKLGNVTGIIHGAGRLADKLIENKTEADFNAVFDMKVQGLLAVAQSVNIEDIKHVVLFSSVAGFYGNVSQTDYAIANEILNKMAHLFKKNHPNIHVVSINWGAWDSGMVSPELKKIFKENKISLVPTDEGPKAMIDQLSKVYANQQQVILGGTLPSAKAATDGPLNTFVLHRTLLESANPFLKHHVIQGNAVLPIINASTWMAQSAADLYPGFHLARAEDVKLFNGIVFDGNQQDEYLTNVEEIEKSETLIKVKVNISSDNGTKLPTNHYRSIITLTSERREAPSIALPDINSYNPVEPNASIIYEDGTLFHGDDFRGVKQILELNKEGTLLLCEHEGVDPNRQGQFPVKELNVFLTDVMYQSLLIWIRRYHDCASLPLSTEAVEIYKVLPFARPFFVSLKVISSDDFGMEADITAFDAETGQVYMISRKARVTMSKELQWA
ncbi:MAG TPA: SDR family NAD(P)-dependent oxidoreductase, partial [Flavobacteriales bacterium]|nr:SDR family NAD(P)-dependent oxidoreductase [Flavobacteriales bacterium]